MIRIKCPDANLNRSERIRQITDIEFRKWVTNQKLIKLMKIFDKDYYVCAEDGIQEIINKSKSFVVENWDYRKKQREAMTKEGEAARWLLKDEAIVDANSELIFECASTLGLIGSEDTVFDDVDYILPLGGARMSNLRRCELARKIVDNMSLQNANVIALSGMRPIGETEMSGYIDTYAPNAEYEFEAISTGLEIAFGCEHSYTEEKHISDNPNSNYVVRKYNNNYKSNNIYSIAAPSTDPEKRRANSADCFKFFFDKFNIKNGDRLLNCTSQIYCSYQQVRALFFAIENNVVFDTIGFPFALNSPNGKIEANQLSKPVNYLQEIKATIDGMYDFLNMYYV